MLDATHDAELEAFLVALDTSQERCLAVAVPRAAQGVADLVAEGGNTRHLLDMGFHGELVARIGAGTGTPTLSVNEDVLGYRFADGIHRLDIMHAHQVEAEAVDVVFLDPIFHALDHELAHRLSLACRLVATTAAVAVTAVGILAVEVVGTGKLEVTAVNVPGVVVHHVEDDFDTRRVQGLHHLLELVDTYLGLIGVGRIASLGHVVVHRVITPVILRFVQACLVHRGIVERRQDVYRVYTQFLEVGDGTGFSQGEEFPLIIKAARLVDGEVAVVHLIEDEILGRNVRSLIVLPTFRVGLFHIDNSAALAVHAYCGGPNARALAAELATVFHVKGVEHTLQVSLNGGIPHGAARLGSLHVNGLDGFAAQAVLVDAQFHLLGIIIGLYCKTARAGAIVDPSASVEQLWYE